MYAIQRYDDAQQSAFEQNILLFGMGFFEYTEGDPEALDQVMESLVTDWEVLAQTKGIQLDNAVVEALNSSDKAVQAEGEAGAIAQIYYELSGFKVGYGQVGENDVETPLANIEVKSGSERNAIKDLVKKFNNGVSHPEGVAYVIYGPGWSEEDAMRVYSRLGSLDSGEPVYVATNPTQLIEIMVYFMQEGPPSF
ncbi:MAG: hypothetical protein WCD86_12760 [Ktedonobacteraceae bacterium]